MISRLIAITAIAVCLTMLWCSGNSSTAGGTGEETTNGIVATVCLPGGAPAAGATVRLRGADFVSPLPSTAKARGIVGADGRTDDRGRFFFADVEPGAYAVEVGDGASAVLFACTVGSADTLDLGTDTLRPLATIRGSVDSLTADAYVRVRGLDRLARVDSAGRFAFTDIPAGTFGLELAGQGEVTLCRIANVRATPGSTTAVEANAGWRYTRRLYINTALSGAGVFQDVESFPLLVRLDATNFDFAQAQSAGQDLRFAKDDGSPLAYEIERWDSVMGIAEVWVRVDTVYGGNSSQFVQMRWGNAAASSQSDPAAVFDTANGFSGVWHLSQEAPDTGAVDLYRDATANRFHGSDNIFSTLREGVIGFGHGFDSTRGDFVNLGANRDFVGGASAVTMEGWVKLRAGVSAGGTVIAHSVSAAVNPDASHAYLLAHTRIRVGGRCLEGDPEQAITTDTVLTVATWHHVSGIIDYGRDSLYLMVNGEIVMAGATGFTMPALPSGSSTSSAIGSGEYPYADFFDGSLDEVRTHRVRRSVAWTKLSFETQKPGTAVVEHTVY